jgi:lysophospholipase L1-like esterase
LIGHLTDGSAFFAGTVMILAAVLLSSLLGFKLRGILIYPLVILGVSGILLSATPLALWFYLLWGTAVVVWLWVAHRIVRRRHQVFSGIVVAVLCLAAVAMEVPYHLIPDIPQGQCTVFYVIGDSVSAGIGGPGEQAWPQILGRTHHIRTVNLARAGATVASAIQQTELVREPHAMVLIEIGGNDLFPAIPSNEFRASLDQLLSQATGPSRTVVMLELPLLPFQNEFGRIQRRLAEKYRVILVPKRFWVAILSSRGATVDLAHLSPEGQRLMAERMWSILHPAMGQ